ncbi:MAG: UDP-N-acetylglucosamine 2-epimerase [bacterium]
MRKICVLTGTRAEYGLLKPVIKAIQGHPKLDLSLVVAGMHLCKEFGYTIKEIRRDGFDIRAIVHMNPQGDTGYFMAHAVGRGIKTLADKFRKERPDILVVLGDRIEALSATIAAAYMNIAVSHIHGGDISKAGLDESCRHAITRFAHIHFAATKLSALRLLKMGEEAWRIFVVGSPGLDSIVNDGLINREELERRLKIRLKNPIILMFQHSVTTQVNQAAQQIKETIKAIKELHFQTIIIYPNSDAGGRRIIQEIEKLRRSDFMHIYKNLSHKIYLSLMNNVDVLVGNSSSGIVEAPSFRLPVVNIGIRQFDRERAGNVIDVEHSKVEIIKGIKRALSESFKAKMKNCLNPYGDGKTSKRIVKILSQLEINDNLLQKRLNGKYLS